MRCWLPTFLFQMCPFDEYVSKSAELVADSVKAICTSLFGGMTFLQALSLAYAYTYAQDNPGRQVSFFIITFDSKFLPYSMLLMTFIIDGPEAALTQLSGLLAAHMYDFLTRIWPTFGGGRNLIFTPSIVSQWFGAAPGSVQNRGYGTAQQARPRDAAGSTGSSTGRTTGFGGHWTERGPGRRLGDS